MSGTKTPQKQKSYQERIAKSRAILKHLRRTRTFDPFVEKYTDEKYSN